MHCMQFTQPRFWIPILLLIAATACGTGDSTSPDTQSAAASNQAEQQEDQNEGVTTIAAGTNEDSESSIPSADEPAVDTVDLTVGVPFGIVQIATLGGIGEAPGLGSLARTTTTPITNPDELRTGFASGELDVAIMPTNVAALLFNREIDVQVIGIIDAQLLHVLGPAGSDWSDLNGATIHIPFRASDRQRRRRRWS